MGKHVVVGAGQVGARLARTLQEWGHDVVLVSRSGSGPDTVERVSADASDRDRLTSIAKGADTLYNCVNPPYHRWPQDWPPMAAAMLAAAGDTSAGYVILGNLYVYGPSEGPMRETDPLAPSSVKAEVRARIWRDALAAHEAGRVRATELRASDYFGPGCRDQSHMGDRFVPPLLAGNRVRFAGDPAQPHSWTYVPDVARALATAGTGGRAYGHPWHVPTSPALSAREVAERLCAIAGVPNPGVGALPHWLIRAGGLVSPMLRELEAVRYQFVRPFIVDSSAFEDAFGMAPTSMDEALETTLAWWREPRG